MNGDGALRLAEGIVAACRGPHSLDSDALAWTQAVEAVAAILAPLVARAEALEAMLREVEWGGTAIFGYREEDHPCCPCCGGWRPRRLYPRKEWKNLPSDELESCGDHRPGCRLAALLGADDARREVDDE